MTFTKGNWENEWIVACTYRYQERSQPRQLEDCIASLSAEEHPEKFDNFALFKADQYTADVSAEIHCSFEEDGCPEIVLTDDCEQDENGAWRYGACIEVVLYRGGINVWRHYRENNRCFRHKRLGVSFPVAETQRHTLSVKVRPTDLDIAVDGQQITLRIEDIPERFYLGTCMCEGVARVYNMRIEK